MLTEEQRSIRASLLKGLGRDQVQTLGGFAGTGKTTLLVALAERLPGFAPCAFTGKAAHVLRQKGVSASTIHSLIYRPMEDGSGIRWVKKEPYEIHDTGFLVDEASMIGRDLHEDLLSYGLPIVFVGDHGQLPPVGSDIYLMADPQYWLETIHRNAGPIAHFAEHLRKGKRPGRFDGGSKVVVSAGTLPDGLLTDANQIIVAFNKTRVGINRRVRLMLGYQADVQRGDRILCLRNNRPLGLFNGQQGRVCRVHPGHTLTFKSDGAIFRGVPYDPEQFNCEKAPDFGIGLSGRVPFDFAYTLTCHKAQGDEFGSVVVVEQHCDFWDHSRWAYTAASRARSRLHWLAPARLARAS
jgi:exodeoxyribonuclease-5